MRLKRHFSVIGHGPDILELRHGVWNPTSVTITDSTSSGRLYRLMSQLDGSMSAAELARKEGVPLSEVEALIDHLFELDAIEKEPQNIFELHAAWQARGDEPTTEPRPILVLGDEEIADKLMGALREALPRSNPVRLSSDDEAARLLAQRTGTWLTNPVEFGTRLTAFESWRERLVVVTLNTIDPWKLIAVNRLSLALGFPWLHAVFDGPFLFVGPTFVPKRSACYECFEARITMNLREAASYQRYKQALMQNQVSPATTSAGCVLSSLLCSHAMLEAASYALTRECNTIGKVLAIYLPTMEIAFNEVLRLPGCRACGSSSERDDSELYFDVRSLFEH